MKHWYVAQTLVRAEETARLNLARQGFEPYLPRYWRERRHARRRDLVKAPLFPGYIFVQLDLEKAPWRSINGTLGVSQLICNGERPSAVAEGVVEAIRAREGDDGLIQLQAPTFQKGEALRIVSGALADCFGFFEKMADQERVILLLDLLGRKVQVQAPLGAVVPGP
ncbi:transcriptional activator RfaH [Pelagibius litoralis]|uniref:Transcriptional activator RfaH n=1 Tax=Pelagibius litoralis TaxID=374515 RepID=A0A967C289_9PROT|nr:transcription termination/antitermination NusG family protein [Pelagibius litoralis]NIA69031.1 transcriptional activator RfaH [Pelagibius litoralis]